MPATVLQSFQDSAASGDAIMEVSFTPAAGSNRRIDVFGFVGGGPGLATATFDGVSLTHQGRNTNSYHVDVLTLLEANFPVGAGPFLLSYDRKTTGGQGRLFVVVTQDASQTLAFEANQAAGYTTTMTASVNITTLTDGALLLLAAMATGSTTTDAAGQTRLQTVTAADRAACSSKAVATAGATTAGYTFGNNNTGILRAVAIAPAAGGGGGGLPHVAVLNALL